MHYIIILILEKHSSNKKTAREFNGLAHCVLKVQSIDGIKGLYNGYGISVTGVCLYRALYFGLFDIVKKLWASQPLPGSHDTPKPPFLVGLILAQVYKFLENPQHMNTIYTNI